MSEQKEFTGKVVRVEPDGFGIVEFESPLGLAANTHGVFSTTISSTVPWKQLRTGIHVTGTAEVDSHDFAAVKTLKLG